MALKHAHPLDVIDLFHRPALEPEPPVSISLLRTTELQIIRLVLPAGHRMPSHHVQGVVTLQCLTGSVDIEAGHGRCTLVEGQLVMLPGDEPHSLHAPQAAVVLLTLMHRAAEKWQPRDASKNSD